MLVPAKDSHLKVDMYGIQVSEYITIEWYYLTVHSIVLYPDASFTAPDSAANVQLYLHVSVHTTCALHPQRINCLSSDTFSSKGV